MAEEQLSEAAQAFMPKPPEVEEPPISADDDRIQESAPTSEEQPGTGAAPDGANEEPEKAEPFNPKQLAEKLGIKPSQLYDALTIKLGDSEMTLGEIKDRAKDVVASDAKLKAANEHAETSELDLLRKTQGLQLAMQSLGRQPTEAEMTRAAELHNGYAKEQAGLALGVIPEWADTSVKQADDKKMSAMLTEYGFSAVEAGQIHDFRHVKLLRDFALMRERLDKAAKAEVRTNRNQPGKSKRRSASQPKSAKERHASGELSATQAVIAAIAEG